MLVFYEHCFVVLKSLYSCTNLVCDKIYLVKKHYLVITSFLVIKAREVTFAKEVNRSVTPSDGL